MARRKTFRDTKTSNTKRPNKKPQIGNTLFTFVAAFMGVVIGVGASFAVLMPVVQAQLASQSKQLDQRMVSMLPASTTLSCAQPSSSLSSMGHILGATTGATTLASSTTPTPSQTSVTTGPSQTFVSKLVSGVFAHTKATISNTGPQSQNSIATTNTNTTTVTNDNNISVTSSNNQSAQSGTATTKDNTTGGSATSGSIDNSNSSSATIDINN